MIFYRPTDGDVYSAAIQWRTKTCFIMAAMGKTVPTEVVTVRKRLIAALKRASYSAVDAASATTGKDYLLKIWSLAIACRSLADRAEYYLVTADQLEQNPLLAIDYLRRSYLLSGDTSLKKRVTDIFGSSGLATRSADSVERNLARL